VLDAGATGLVSQSLLYPLLRDAADTSTNPGTLIEIARKNVTPGGSEHAPDTRMPEPVRKHTDLIAWQLCHRLRALVLNYTRTGPVAREFDYRRQLRKAARSSCYLTSEGFYRYEHGEFGHFLNLAHGSIGESLDQIDEGLQQHYFTEAQHTEMRRLAIRALKANVALRRSWKRGPKPPGL
jgi:four helix bundle protein